MAFTLEHGEPVAAGVRRLGDEVLAEAIAQLRDGTEPAVAIHTARKATKRVRALARLARPGLGKSAAREADVEARDAARRLAGYRDAHVVEAARAGLIATAGNAAAYEGLREQLSVTSSPVDPGVLAVASDALEQLRERIGAWELRTGGWGAIGGGLESIYRRGATQMRKAVNPTTAERLHDWRKSVKYLWHAVEVLSPAWPPVLGALAEEVHALSDHLGDDHDLHVLGGHLQAAGATVDSGALSDLIARRHADLRASAFTLGLRIYAEKPGPFVARLKAYSDAWAAQR